jgi:hypothetical protein
VKLFSTRAHGILDFVTSGTLFALPRLLGWSKATTSLLTNAAIGSLVYSLLTRYEFGLLKVLPMKGHLTLDAISGATLAAAPFMFLDEDSSVSAALVGLGLFEITAALTTETEPSIGEQASEFLESTTSAVQDGAETLQERTAGA